MEPAQPGCGSRSWPDVMRVPIKRPDPLKAAPIPARSPIHRPPTAHTGKDGLRHPNHRSGMKQLAGLHPRSWRSETAAVGRAPAAAAALSLQR